MAFTPKLTYKGRPLVRCKNDIYYGSLSDPYVIFMQVDRKSTRLNSSHLRRSRIPSSA